MTEKLATETAKALQAFFSSFGVSAYPENNIPEDAELPYISYTPIFLNAFQTSLLPVRVWTRSESFQSVMSITDKIANAVQNTKTLVVGKGFIRLSPSSPFIQPQVIDSKNLKVNYINLEVTAYTLG